MIDLIDRWVEIYDRLKTIGLTSTQRVAGANGILLAEAQGVAGTTSGIIYKAEDGSGVMSLQEMREALRNSTDGWNTFEEAEIIRIYSELSGKVWKRL